MSDIQPINNQNKANLLASNNLIVKDKVIGNYVNNGAVDNKAVKDGDTVTIPLLNKEVKKRTAVIVAGLAAIGTAAIGAFAIIKHAKTPKKLDDSLEKTVKEGLNALSNSIKKLDNEANEASKRAENLWKNNIESYNKGTETRTDGTLIREITHFGNEMLEYAQDGKTVTRKTTLLLGNPGEIEEYVGTDRKNILEMDMAAPRAYTEYEKLQDGTWKPIKVTEFYPKKRLLYSKFKENADFDFSLSENLATYWQDSSKEVMKKLDYKPSFYYTDIEIPAQYQSKSGFMVSDYISDSKIEPFASFIEDGKINTTKEFLKRFNIDQYESSSRKALDIIRSFRL